MGWKSLGEGRVEKLKANARSPKMKVWMIRATTMVLLWTCLVQLTALGDTWGPRVLKGWPSTTSSTSSFTQDSHSLDVKLLPIAPARVLPPKRVYQNNGYLMVSCNGGLNQMRSAITARKISSDLEDNHGFSWGPKDDSQENLHEFEDIFDVNHFITSLRDEVRILKQLPPRLKKRVESGIVHTMPPVSWSDISYYHNQILPLIKKHKVVHLNRTDARLANNGQPLELQKLRCRVNFNALRFTPQIEYLGRRVVQLLRRNGPFLVLHLRYEMDMLAFSGCTQGCNPDEVEELTRMRYAYPWWKEKIINSELKRKDGLCPLTPEETALTLRALDIDSDIQIYVAAGEIYGGQRRMAALQSAFPKLVRKETLLGANDLQFFQNHSSQMAALDYLVSLESDIFIPTYDGNMAKVVEGHRRYLGFKKTILLNRKLVVELIDQYTSGSLSWDEFSGAVKAAHTAARMGSPKKRVVLPERPKEEDYFYANPEECLQPPLESEPVISFEEHKENRNVFEQDRAQKGQNMFGAEIGADASAQQNRGQMRILKKCNIEEVIVTLGCTHWCMPRRRLTADLVPFDPEIERTARKLRKQAKLHKSQRMGDANPPERVPMRNLATPNLRAVQRGAPGPNIPNNNFEIKHGTIQLVQANQFGGSALEDPHSHLRTFEKICNTFKMNGPPEDAIKLRLFPFSLRDRAAAWEESLPAGQIETWNDMIRAFLNKFFPPGRTAQLLAEITHFTQGDLESLYETWERYKGLLKKCPHHGLNNWMIIQTFFGGLHQQFKNDITAAAGGALMNKTFEEAWELIENLAEHSYATPRSAVRRVASVQEPDELKEIKAQLVALTSQLKGTSLHMAHQGDGGYSDQFQSGGEPQQTEQVQLLQNKNRPRNDPFSDTYNEGWRNHPNLSYGGQRETMGQQQAGNRSNFSSSSQSNNVYRPPGYNQRKYEAGENKSGLEEMMMKFASKIENTVGELASSMGTMATTVGAVKAATEQNTASIRILEGQMGQIADALNIRNQGQFPSQTERKMKEDCNAIQLRNGKELGIPKVAGAKMPEKRRSENIEEQDDEEVDAEIEMEEKNEKKENSTTEAPKPASKSMAPRVPYPNRLKSHKDEIQFSKFLEVFKKLHINIPFADALAQMPSYVKFLKDIISNKRKIEEHATVALTEECSAIIQNKLPQKLKDPGSFTIPIQIGVSTFGKALCDLGASINLMPLSIFRKLGLGEVQPTNVILQLADRSIKYPYGAIEDVLVKVGKFYFPVDFFILDIDEDKEIPLILGRPFLATGGALIDVQGGKLTLRVGDESVEFNVFRTAQNRRESEGVHQVDMIDTLLEDTSLHPNRLDAYENAASYTERTKRFHDRHLREKVVEVPPCRAVELEGSDGAKFKGIKGTQAPEEARPSQRLLAINVQGRQLGESSSSVVEAVMISSDSIGELTFDSPLLYFNLWMVVLNSHAFGITVLMITLGTM
ncbi:hypothetical protein OSB04_005229 [Centaurea solstitialis]|uniref:O-fucosyltransferase family protein n=1 Tax=Centaurea solstitialis TaxID=347529 RepID=A0AA38TFL2_9ASTR|nr:hypothetical protein OSB04_005229 [Centaurea solstitialis]